MWIVGIRDDVNGEAAIFSSRQFQQQQASQRRDDGEISAALLFARKGSSRLPPMYQSVVVARTARARQAPQQLQHQVLLRQQFTMHNTQLAQQGQAAARAPPTSDITQMSQPQLAMHRKAASSFGMTAGKPRPKTLSSKPKAVSQTKSQKSKALSLHDQQVKDKTSKDAAVRRAALDYIFREGAEVIPLKTLCDGFSGAYQSTLRVINNDLGEGGLHDLLKKRNAGEGLTRLDRANAVDRINELFPAMPPLKAKLECKGVQHKRLDEYVANVHCDKEYLSTLPINNFRGWRHKDCQLYAEIEDKAG